MIPNILNCQDCETCVSTHTENLWQFEQSNVMSSIKKLSFSEEEDQLLTRAVAEFGVDDWKVISRSVGRSRFDCLLRWHQHMGSKVMTTKGVVTDVQGYTKLNCRDECDEALMPNKSPELSPPISEDDAVKCRSNDELSGCSKTWIEDEVEILLDNSSGAAKNVNNTVAIVKCFRNCCRGLWNGVYIIVVYVTTTVRHLLRKF